jgi:hypothetical protein
LELGLKQVDRRLLNEVVDSYSFERITGRKPGEEERNSFVRKGITGDWRNHFTREAAEIFDRWAGRLLIELGYESDREWVRSVT